MSSSLLRSSRLCQKALAAAPARCSHIVKKLSLGLPVAGERRWFSNGGLHYSEAGAGSDRLGAVESSASKSNGVAGRSGRSRVAQTLNGASQFRRMKVNLLWVVGGILVFGYAGRAFLLKNMHDTHLTITKLQDARVREGLEASLAQNSVRWDVVQLAVELEEARIAKLEAST